MYDFTFNYSYPDDLVDDENNSTVEYTLYSRKWRHAVNFPFFRIEATYVIYPSAAVSIAMVDYKPLINLLILTYVQED